MRTRLPARTITMNGLSTRYRRALEDLGKIGSTVAFAAALPKFFRERITLQQAEEEIKRLLEKRVERFLDLARTEIYERPGSPYLKLLSRDAGLSSRAGSDLSGSRERRCLSHFG